MIQSRVTKEAQNAYFKKQNPDPWGYENPFVRQRLDNSLLFLRKFVPSEFSGVFVELGAFNGDFTRKLADAFPSSKVSASDLVKVAWENAEAVQSFPKSVTFEWTDMLDYQLPGQYAGIPAVILLMECLYYLRKEDQPVAIGNLIKHIPKAKFCFVSSPAGSGSFYLSKSRIVRLMSENGMSLQDSEKLNTTYSRWRRYFFKLTGRDFRPGQAIYCFKRDSDF